MLWFSRSNKETSIAHAQKFSSAQAQEAAYAQAQGQLSCCLLQITGLTAATTSFKILTKSSYPISDTRSIAPLSASPCLMQNSK